MLVTVAICTWNRAKLLDQTLAQMRSLKVPEGVEWELLVVNNNSTDDTDGVLQKYQSELPLRRLLETKQGHSHARNCAIQAAQGELLIWTDDDVLVDPDWLSEYVAAVKRWPDACYFGGTIEPWLEKQPPSWMRRHWDSIGGIFVLREFGPYVGPIQKGQSLAGANMAFRTEALKREQFDTKLGRVGSTLTGADDTEIVERLRSEGKQGIWVGTARVAHYLPAERLTRNFLRQWFIGAGRTQVRQRGFDPSASLFGAPRWAIRRYGFACVRQWCYEAFRGPKWFEAFRDAAIMEGFIAEHRERKQTRS